MGYGHVVVMRKDGWELRDARFLAGRLPEAFDNSNDALVKFHISAMISDFNNEQAGRAWLLSSPMASYNLALPYLVEFLAGEVRLGRLVLHCAIDSRYYFRGEGRAMSTGALAKAAADLRVDEAVITAVARVESRGAGFLPDREPTILFERHRFSEWTGRVFDFDYPAISNAKSGGYGIGYHEYDRLSVALSLNERAALESTSWGRFQILGRYHQMCGYPTIADFVEGMMQSEDLQLEAFLAYVRSKKLVDALRGRRWSEFAEGYNGKNQHGYDARLKTEYDACKR